MKTNLSRQNLTGTHPDKEPRWVWIAIAVLLPATICLAWWCGSLIYRQFTFRPTGQIITQCDWNNTTLSSKAIPAGNIHFCAINADGAGYQEIPYPFGAGYQQITASDNFDLLNYHSQSHDGTRIAFSRRKIRSQGSLLLSVMNLDGSGLTQLTDESSIDTISPSWSPQDDRIAFAYFSGIAVVNVDGSGLKILTTSPHSNYVRWAPYGERIAFAYSLPGAGTDIFDHNIYIINSDGSNRKALVEFNADSPAWSPDGEKIAFRSKAGIWTINTDGSGLTILTSSPMAGPPTWSPDGQYIAYRKTVKLLFCICFYTDETDQLWVIKADGSQETQLKNLFSIPYAMIWQPAP